MTSPQTSPTSPIPQRPRLLFADDHHLILDALNFVLSPDYEVLTVDSLKSCEGALTNFAPDLVILDIKMPDGDGIETAKRFIREHPDLKIMFLSMHTESMFVERAIEAGAKAYLSKQAPADEIASAIRTVLEGGKYFAPKLQAAQELNSGLTERQTEVLRLIARGKSAKEIANDLGISVRTAEFHRAAIMNRLNLHSTAMMTRYALDKGIE